MKAEFLPECRDDTNEARQPVKQKSESTLVNWAF